ncbi:hypothetical protein EVAR_96943_1 [Eumeta japonica]|uniref:Uncharacterized protein n=1 Tax=Eumeta variegata TaxID=151549 RepID=A0A4C1VEH3_EUMVA|nr:hypothetical protein EVAR_96943_1 [Eumeta japonica]
MVLRNCYSCGLLRGNIEQRCVPRKYSYEPYTSTQRVANLHMGFFWAHERRFRHKIRSAVMPIWPVTRQKLAGVSNSRSGFKVLRRCRRGEVGEQSWRFYGFTCFR